MNNKQLSLVNSSLNRIFNSPLSSFVDEFFSNDLPLSLIDREKNFPKYNIYYAPTSEDDSCDDDLGYDKNKFIIELALAGYCKENLDVYTKDGTLYVEDITAGSVERKYMYKGISENKFKWWLKLPKNANVTSVDLKNGLLQIAVEIKVPEEVDRVTYKIK